MSFIKSNIYRDTIISKWYRWHVTLHPIQTRKTRFDTITLKTGKTNYLHITIFNFFFFIKFISQQELIYYLLKINTISHLCELFVLICRCPVDPTVKFYNSPDNDGTSRFSITSFQFVNLKSRAFYSHCGVLVCDKNDQSEQCNPTCQQQQHRVTNTPIRSKRTKRSYRLVKTKDGIFEPYPKLSI